MSLIQTDDNSPEKNVGEKQLLDDLVSLLHIAPAARFFFFFKESQKVSKIRK